ncbi:MULTISPECIES: PKD domain-containing protein [unclassified Pseudoalteromonas]|uniref:PKD domain-containing protein n=1 Tax=unclassified Pseudoalteromonas TaxID=194690 RepID=UPI000C088EE4|nr:MULTISPECIES: PKD domain-containing protein [unclassified Pseudoalteromonas]MDP2635593.1 PKD domain-containing protein [Pseudoalteromonas sp. 1_MG-2023]PHN88912.1 hypothetical protein CSC79_15605 [Pseudoalteromonas sp. 3D05]
MRYILTMFLVIFLAACNNDDSKSVPVKPQVTVLPIADAGQPMMLQKGATAVLNGSGSYDPDGASITYAWSVVSQPTASSSQLSAATTPYPSLFLDAVGDYEIQLIVSNGEEDSLPAIVKISDSDSIPVANAGPDQTAQVNQAVTLNGAMSFDSDGDQLSYTWTLESSPTGSAAMLARSDTAFPVLTPDVSGDYELQLIVNDGNNDSAPDTVIVSDLNIAPVANSEKGTTYTIGVPVMLDGSASSDVDGDPLSYQWSIVSQPAGSTATIVDADSVSASITPDVDGDYIISLVVNDGQIDSALSNLTLHRENHIPIADAGSDLTAQLGQVIHLNGTGSSDGDGDPLVPRWSISSKPKNSSASLADVNTLHPILVPDMPGDYVIQLIVNDGQYLSAADAVIISTTNIAPVANAGDPQKVVTGQAVNLDGSKSTDPEGDSLSYRWTLLAAPTGSSASLSATDVVSPSFTPDEIGNYVFQLVVNDGEKDSAPATVVISDQDLPPVARAGADQSVSTGSLVTLDATTSSDPESQPLSYNWSLLSSPSTSTSVLSDSDRAIATFRPDTTGDYVAQLTVTDAAGQKSSDTIIIRNGSANTLPIADAGADQVSTNTRLVLDGSGSRDADGDSIYYSWAMLSRPAGSSATLNNDKSRNPDFTPDVQGDFVIQLVVSDGKSTSLPDIVVVHDSQKNIAPVARIGFLQDAVTANQYQLDGSTSFDQNGDALSYQWTLYPPSSSAAVLQGSTVEQPTFTPDIAGDYGVSLVVNDGVLNSQSVSATITVADPVQGAARPLPPGHNLLMLSATGGDSGSGALISIEESDLTKASEILSLHGVPPIRTSAHIQSPVLHPTNGKVYLLIDETGLNHAGAILEFDPEGKTTEVYLNIPNLTLNGNRVRFFRNQLLFDPSGHAIYLFAQRGGVSDAGVLFHINNNPASANFKTLTVIAEFGQPDGAYGGSLTSPISDLAWNGTNKIVAAFGFSRTQPRRSPVELTPSDSADLTKPWTKADFGGYIALSGRKFTVDNDYLLLVENGSPLIFTGHGRSSGGGFSIRECHNTEGTFPWGPVDIFIMCKGGGGFAPVLYRSNGSAAQPVLERLFSNLTGREVNGVIASTKRDTAYMTVVDESASAFLSVGRAAIEAAGITISPPTLSEVSKVSYVDSSVIVGGGDRGIYFIGDPVIVDRSSDPLNDRFVSVLSADGGADERGALLTLDRLTGVISQSDFGFERGGYPFGRATKASSGDYFFSTVSSSAGSNNTDGSTTLYDPSLGVTEEVLPSRFFRTGLGLAETSNKVLYGLGIERRRGVYALYSIDVDSLAFTELGDFASTSEHVPSYELTVNDDKLWFFTGTKLFCFDPATNQRESYSFATAAAHDPVRAISFMSNGSDGFFATRGSAVAGQGTIQRLTNNCALPTISGVVAGLTDLPTTALLAASDGNFYYGTEGGKLMQFDGVNTVVEVAGIANASMVGFLTEDANGDIVGFASNGNAVEDQMYAYTLSNGAFTNTTVPADTPIDSFYPGVTEIN